MQKQILHIIFTVLFFTISLSAQISERQKTPNWKVFEQNYGNTILQWKEGMFLPHRVICSPINLANSIENKTQLETLLRNFIQENKAIFKIENSQIEVWSIHKARKIWYANFVQKFDGKAVLDVEIVFRVHENGNLFVFGMDYFEDIHLNNSRPKSKEEITTKLETIYVQKNIENLEIRTEKEQLILPVKTANCFVFKTIYISKVHNHTDFNELVYIDAHSSEIIKTIPKVCHFDIDGNVQGEIFPTVPTDNPTFENLANMYLDFDGSQVVTDNLGNFEYTSPNTSTVLTAQLKGPYVDVIDFVGNDATITQTIEENETVNIVWDDSNSTMSERNVFYHVNKIHKKNKEIDPNFTTLDYPLQCIVNDNSATCNAFFNGTSLHFNTIGGACSMNSAHGASVVYHEYGHAINDRVFNQTGVAFGMGNQALHEAFADIYACLLLDDSRFALGWTGVGTFTRNLNNFNTYPISIVGQQHIDGLILGGAFWDLRMLTSADLAYELAHFAKYGTPDDNDLGMAFSEVYIETLIADDDDGNLMNGTPNSDAIENAFCQHGIGSRLFAVQQVTHTVLPNTLDTENDYLVEITMPASPFIANSLNQMSLVYTTNNFIGINSVNFSQIDENTYQAVIPSQEAGTLVKYYFRIPNGSCGTSLTHPSRDFLYENYAFYVGDYVTVFEDDFETSKGWGLFDPTDNATFGLWQRADPALIIDSENFVVQPDEGHSEEGNKCLVTGAIHGAQWYSFDVDGGQTTVTSPIFDDLNETSIATFYKWFVHGAGFVYPAQGEWRMEITNNGIDWNAVEITNYGDHRYWIKDAFKISNLIEITDHIQFRFVASDFGAGSIVEALVDDFSIVSLASTVSTKENELGNSIQIFPNPVDSEIYLTYENLPSSDISINIFSITGQLVDSYSENNLGNNGTVKWKGNLNVLSGIYFLEVISGQSAITKKMVFK